MNHPTEIPLKTWIINQAIAENLKPKSVWRRYYKGKYPPLQLRRVNKRVVLVRITE